jgi:hypothetical protein
MKGWDKIIVDRKQDLAEWVEVLKTFHIPEKSQCRNSAARRMVLLVEEVFLGAAARKWITKAAKVPAKLPKMANPKLWVVYENANPAMSIARREPRAKASLVANSDRRRLGTTIPAMNKVNATSISSRASEKTFCLFMVFAFSLRTGFSKNPVCGRMDLAEQRQAYGYRFSQGCLPRSSQIC